MKKNFALATFVLWLCVILQTTAFARAGGGGGGFSGGGSGGIGYFARNFVRNLLGESFGTLGYFLYVLIYVVIILTVLFVSFLTYLHIRHSRRKSKILLKKLGKNDPVWNPKSIDRHIRQSFYDIQNAWSLQNVYSVRHLLSDSLYEDFKLKLERNRKENVVNKLSKIKLKKAYPVSVQDRIGEDNDCIWYHIYASMLDLTYEESSMRLLSDVKKPMSFVEYWRFCKKDGKWVLDCIMQDYEFTALYVKSERPQ